MKILRSNSIQPTAPDFGGGGEILFNTSDIPDLDWRRKDKITSSTEKETAGRFIKDNDFKAQGTKFSSYMLDGKPSHGFLTVEKSKKNGWRIWNVYVAPEFQKQNVAANAYVDLNNQSMSATGKPLRSSHVRRSKGKQVTTLNDQGEALWRALVTRGAAEFVDDTYYRFIP